MTLRPGASTPEPCQRQRRSNTLLNMDTAPPVEMVSGMHVPLLGREVVPNGGPVQHRGCCPVVPEALRRPRHEGRLPHLARCQDIAVFALRQGVVELLIRLRRDVGWRIRAECSAGDEEVGCFSKAWCIPGCQCPRLHCRGACRAGQGDGRSYHMCAVDSCACRRDCFCVLGSSPPLMGP